MPSLATTTQGPLGCGSYSVQLVNAGQPILESKRTTSVVWNRRLDEPSTSTVTLPVQGTDLRACCDGVNRIEPLRTEVIVNRNGIPVWQGFLMRDVAIRRDNIIVNAHDILGWTERRTIKTDQIHVAADLTDIALDYIADINAAGDLPFVITSLPTGVLADRTVLALEDRWAADPLKDLYDTGLDATVVAGHVLLGPETPTCGTLTLRDNDIDGDPEIKLDGLQRATRVVVKGANGIRVVWPVTPPDVCILDADYVLTDESILDAGSALAAAQALYERLSAAFPYYVSIPQGSGLRASAPVHINALIPGTLVQFTTDALCLPISMTMRLTALDVEASAETEQVRVSLEPIGGEFGDGA
jgi:hypothetical protein